MVRFGKLVLLVAFAGIVLAPSRAGASTINTYSFTQDGWVFVPTGNYQFSVQGTFTGLVEVNGLIAQSDLTSFQMTITEPLAPVVQSLQFFSFDTNGDASTLDIINQREYVTGEVIETCIGAAATLSPICNPLGGNPTDTRGVARKVGFPYFFFYTAAAPNVRLQSSVTVPDPVTTIPEPTTLILLGTGVIGLIATKRRRRAA
jgi:hypothetical protein